MNTEDKSTVQKVYAASNAEESREAYNDWANSYDQDVFELQSRFPFAAAAAFTRFVKPGDGPILDAGCGTGLQMEPVALAGYDDIVGIDLSDGMLEVAASKGIYRELRRMMLGERLDFEDDTFAHTLTTGTITQGHAPPHSFEELIRVTRKGGYIVFSLRTDPGVDPDYPGALDLYEQRGLWKRVFESKTFAAMPAGEPDVLTTVFVCEVL